MLPAIQILHSAVEVIETEFASLQKAAVAAALWVEYTASVLLLLVDSQFPFLFQLIA